MSEETGHVLNERFAHSHSEWVQSLWSSELLSEFIIPKIIRNQAELHQGCFAVVDAFRVKTW
jgi:hypothetical protein